jgi:hypothetical protein
MKRTLAIIAILAFLVPSYSPAQEEDNSPEAGRKRLGKIAQEIAERAKITGGQRNISAVPADALEESRGEEEDRLRMYLLAWFSPGKTRDRIKDIINRPWDDDTVRDLWVANYGKRGGQIPTGEIYSLIIYAAKKYKGRVFMEVKSRLNDLFSLFSDPDLCPLNYKEGAFLINALEQYGTPDIIPDSFWIHVENEKYGPLLLNVLREIGDKDTLQWLEDFRERCPWQEEKNLRKLQEAIKKLRVKIESQNKPDNQKPQEIKTEPEQENHPKPFPRNSSLNLKKEQEQAEPELIKKPEPEPAPEKEPHASTTESTDLFVPVLIIGVVLLAGVVIFLFLREKRANRH